MAIVLVVDDEVGIVRLLEDVLSDEGHKVVIAVNGRQALERAIEQTPDVVITDFMMPVMDGPTLIKEMSEIPQLANVPIVLMSSLNEATVREHSQRHAAFVHKPFKIFDLIDLVASFAAR